MKHSMWVNDEIQRELPPLKDYVDLARRFQVSFAYPFVRQAFNFRLPELVDYTQKLLGGDARGRYDEYAARLVDTLAELGQAGVQDVRDLVARCETAQQLKDFASQSEIYAHDIVRLLKYLVYWLIPGEKYLSGLIRPDPLLSPAIKTLGGLGIRTNLDLLQRGISPQGRKPLADESGLPEAVILDLVHRADLSRLPWSSKATIANIIGAGYGSLAALASANPDELYAAFFAYGKSIGKNLKHGNEIENSYRIAKIVPRVVF